MTNEEYIISQLAFYSELHHHLPKIQSKWFTNKSLGKIVKAMRIVYESGETVNPFTIRKYLDKFQSIPFDYLLNCIIIFDHLLLKK